MDLRARIQQRIDATGAAWNAHDADALVAQYAEKAEILDIATGIATTGREEIHAAAVGRFAGFADLTLTRRSVAIDSDMSASQWVLRGTHTGEYHDLPPTRRVIELSVAAFCDHDEAGLVTLQTIYIDVPALLRQLGFD